LAGGARRPARFTNPPRSRKMARVATAACGNTTKRQPRRVHQRMAGGRRAWAGFVRLWLVLFFSYAILKLLADLVGGGYIDLRKVALLELVALPFGQAVVFWLITRRARASGERDGLTG
jgi:hypothetical protein